jgi:spore coat protein U-like protein
MKRYLVAFVAALAVASATQAAPSGTAFTPTVSGTMKVSTSVVPACTITTADLPLGNYDARTGIAATPQAIQFLCTDQTQFNIRLSNFSTKLKNGANALTYTLAGPSGPWANNGVEVVTGNGATQSLNVNAAVAANQYVPAGTYSETVTFTMEY